MEILEVARKLAAMGQSEKAMEAYSLFLQQDTAPAPEDKFEAAVYILQSGGNYRVAYTCFHELYEAGYFRDQCLDIMIQAFYAPNIKLLKSRYEKNCKLLAKYPYLFRKDFVPFDKLPICFFPYDDNGYLPFDTRDGHFENYFNPRNTVISRNFFKDLENPVLAADVFSQYELEYLYDNVRKSEWVARENHIYLHYPDWEVFCSYLQVLNFRSLLDDKKIVFLIGEEIAQYPIDFKERYGIDYSQYKVKPVGIREVNRMIWHTQLSTHNGGDFFNEIFDAHPNLACVPSVMMENVKEVIASYKKSFESLGSLEQALDVMAPWKRPDIAREMYMLKGTRTEKDILVAMYLVNEKVTSTIDANARIAPALFFQPHFYNIVYKLRTSEDGRAILESKSDDELRSFSPFRDFKYIKTFTPMRRFTTSHAATVRFMLASAQGTTGVKQNENTVYVVPDAVTQRILNRSFMIDPEDRLFRDSILVRFEDGKLNPKATFAALAAFLDLPYTESMTYCSFYGQCDPNNLGFNPVTVYRTYDEYANESERYYIEYFLRDAYENYGYDFHYYDGAPMDKEKLVKLIAEFKTINHYTFETFRKLYEKGKVIRGGEELEGALASHARDILTGKEIEGFNLNRLHNGIILLNGLRFINKRGQPLRMMPMLQLDPALLEQPLYR